MQTLKDKELETKSEIEFFLAEKPAGKNDLKWACKLTCEELQSAYGSLAIAACSIWI